MTERFVTSLYCDDIRAEIGNKFSYMGVYGPELFTLQLPGALPKLCIRIQVFTPATRPFQSLRVKIYKGEEVIVDIPVPDSHFAISADVRKTLESEQLDEQQKMLSFETQVVVAPLIVEADNTSVRIRVVTESEELRGPALKIRVTPADASTPTASA